LPVRAAGFSRCPSCYSDLEITETLCVCKNGHSYPVVRGVPILIDRERSIFDPSEIAKSIGTPTSRVGVRRLLPVMSNNLAAKGNFRAFREAVLLVDTHPLVLNIGGGEGGVGEAELRDSALEIVVSDVAVGAATNVGADAHRLPFADATFDGVVAQAVLEHVLDPWVCVEEIHRVLKHNGIVYAETPFMQQVHMGRYDFTRFTELGHRRLFRRFEEIDAGPAVGPGSALAWSVVYFIASFARNRRVRRMLSAAGRVMFFWLRWFDRLLETDAAHDAASGFYFLGRRSDVVLSDQELIAQYRGGIEL